MKKFDPNNLSLSAILILVCVFGAPLIFSLWANTQKYQYDGAHSMGVDAHGRLHIQSGNELYRYGRDGIHLDTINLESMGVQDFVGDLTFFPNGELLLRKGNYDPGFLESIAILNRQKNLSSVESETDQGLFRCNLDTTECQRFGDGSIDFDRGYFSIRDSDDGSIFISDASRHTLYKFDNNGELLGKQESGFIFPNQMALSDGILFLVDTNNNVVKEIDKSNASLGQTVNETAGFLTVADQSEFIWPYGLIQAGDYWWSIVLDNNMDQGAVYLFDRDWHYVKSLPLQADAHPSTLIEFAGTVLLTDIESSNIQRFDLDGLPIGTFADPVINQKLAANTELREHYDFLWLTGLTAFFTLAMAAILFAIADFINKTPTPKPSATTIDISTLPADDILWMPMTNPLHQPETQHKLQVSGLAAVLALLASFMFYSYNYSESTAQHGYTGPLSITLAFMLISVCIALLFLTETGRIRIGVYDGKVLLRDRKTNTLFQAAGPDILFDGQVISIGRLSTTIFNLRRPPQKELEFALKNVYLPLADSTTVTPRAMQSYLLRNRDSRLMRQMLAFAAILLSVLVLYLAVLYLQ
ncbi:MAG: hypothetical protein V3U76_18890 [Granulosicoccus sp.]